MEPFRLHRGKAAPLLIDNVDTDMIIPKDYLKTIKRSGLGVNLFEELRRHPDGNERQDFVLNQPKYQGVSVLLSGRNFGCGSSREHAPWALTDYGFRVIIASGFADIFANNSLKNGLLLVDLPPEQVQSLVPFAEREEVFEVDLPQQQVRVAGQCFPFEITASDKKMMLEGLDEISLTLRSERRICDFEKRQAKNSPWLVL